MFTLCSHYAHIMFTLCSHYVCSHCVRYNGNLRVGEICLYAVVGYREDGEHEETGRSLFVQIRPFAADGVLRQDSCGGYTFRTDALTSVREKCWVHASRMCTYMFKPAGTERTQEERDLSMKIVPVAKAFLQD